MSFLIDTDICSAHLRGATTVTNRFLQYTGRLHVSVVTIGELKTWLYRKNTPKRFHAGFDAMIRDFAVLPVDQTIAEVFGQLGAEMNDLGTPLSTADLLLASTTIAFNLTLVTHNVRHFARLTRLAHVDWLSP